jgi:PEP-CTERM motif-containing protein
MNRRTILHATTLSCILLGFGHTALRANPVTFGLTGTVTTVDSPLTAQFSTGNTFSGTITFDDSSPDTYPDAPPFIGLYHNLFSAAHISFSNGYVADFSGGSSDMIVDNTGPDLFDNYVPVTGASVGGMFPDLFEAELRDDQNVMLSSDHIPTTPPSFALADVHDGLLRFKLGQTSKFVSFNVTSLTAVPEPATAALLIFGAALASILGRRSSR